MTTTQFRITSANTGTPKSQAFSNLLAQAKKGGSDTFAFFEQQLNPAYQVAQFIAQAGDSAWKYHSSGSALVKQFAFLDPTAPVFMVSAGSGSLIVQLQMSQMAMDGACTDWKEAGIASVYQVTGTTVFNQVFAAVEMLGPVVAGAALLPAITAILGSVKRFVQTLITQSWEAIVGGATDLAEIATEAGEMAIVDATIEAELIADDVIISCLFPPAAIIGVAVAVVALIVSIILFFVAKTMTCMIKFYNDTLLPLNLKITYQHDLEIQQQPDTGDVPGIGRPPAPPGVTALEPVVYRADYIFQNNSSVEGIGLVIQAHDSSLPAAFMIDIPKSGENSLWAGFNSGDGKSIWEAKKNKFKELSHSNAFDSDGKQYTMNIATNVLKGESQSPSDSSKKGYYYEYVVTLTQSDLV